MKDTNKEIHNIREFTRHMGHAYNNAIGGISGYTELLTNKLPPECKDDEKIKKYLAAINRAVQRATELTEKLSHFAHTGEYEDFEE
jgi:signal transduction histidine kinase